MRPVEIDHLRAVLDETPPAIRSILWMFDEGPLTPEQYMDICAMMTGAYVAIFAISQDVADEYKFFSDFCYAKAEQMQAETWGTA